MSDQFLSSLPPQDDAQSSLPVQGDAQSSLSLQDGVQWADLSEYWPLQALKWPLAPEFRSKIYIRGVDQFGGWKVEQVETRKSREWVQIWSIPPQYGNILGVINSKIMWLQAFLATRISVKNKKSDKGKQEMQTIKILRDSVARCLIFDYTVRRMFFREVAQAFYGNRVPKREYTLGDSSWRSRCLDSWLHVEYVFKSHLPSSYVQLRKSGWVQKHPRDITFEGTLSLSLLMTIHDSLSRVGGLG
jgi:hypothetical protein